MREVHNIIDGWEFADGKRIDLRKKKLPKKAKLRRVTVPHVYERVEPGKYLMKEGEFSYRNNFELTTEDKEKKFYLEFDRVALECVIYVNGKKAAEHAGGFIGFGVDITEYVNLPSGKNMNRPTKNSLVVKCSSRVIPDVPVGKPAEEIDFAYFGGISGPVRLIKTSDVHITHETEIGAKEESGVYIFNDTVTREFALLNMNVNVINREIRSQKVRVIVNVYDMEENPVEQFSSKEYTIKKGKDKTFNVSIRQNNPKLWSPSRPYLYTYVADVVANGKRTDSVALRRGIRTAAIDHRGFVLNGRRTYLRGVNRFADMPYVGNALTAEMEYRDAFKIKKAGFNFVKTGYYPPSRAFIEACDELGLMLLDVIPGYQHMLRGDFVELMKRNINSLALRDRNATSVIMWQVTPAQTAKINSTGASDKIFREFNDTLRSALPFGEKPLIAGDTAGRKDPLSIGYDVPYCTCDYKTKERLLPDMPGRKGLVADYGDYEFGSSDSTSRIERGDEGKMLLQAWNMQWQHNRNRGNQAVLGDVLASVFDYMSALDKGISRRGIMDEFRLPKFSAEFYRSQDERRGAKNVFIPTYWNNERINSLPIYSNCDKVQLYLNGRLIAEQSADEGVTHKYAPFDKKELKNREKSARYALKRGTDIEGRHRALPIGYEVKAARTSPIVYHMVDTMYKGGDCERLAHAPFTFDNIVYEPGELTAVGLMNGEAVASCTVRTYGEPCAIRLTADYSNRALNNDGSDCIFVYAEVVDKNGSIVRSANMDIEFAVNNAEIVGDSPVRVKSGIAATMIRAVCGAESVNVSASGEGLRGKRIGITLNKTVSRD